MYVRTNFVRRIKMQTWCAMQFRHLPQQAEMHTYSQSGLLRTRGKQIITPVIKLFKYILKYQ